MTKVMNNRKDDTSGFFFSVVRGDNVVQVPAADDFYQFNSFQVPKTLSSSVTRLTVYLIILK